jgi:starch synthase (maltosyl-transferring)
MNYLPATAGNRRVIIEHIRPSLRGGVGGAGGAGGTFPIKRVVGDWIPFEVDVFADSHDLIQVELRFRRAGRDAEWQSLPMRALGNDAFTATYRAETIGLFEYEVAALVDHFASWAEGFAKKHAEAQPLDVECAIGAQLLADASGRAPADHAKLLAGWADQLKDDARPIDERIQLALSRHVNGIARLYPQRAWESVSPRHLLLVERERAAFSSWYEFFPRSCRYDGRTHATFGDAAKQLPLIRKMGFNVVYLPPIHPIGRQFRKGKNNTLEAGQNDVGSPWAVGAKEGGHTSVLPELGTLEDFRGFVAEAAKHDMEVALDIAFQCAPDHPWVKSHPEWFRWRPDGTVQYAENPPKKYQDILPINFETEDWAALWEALKSVFLFWVAQGVTIFRVDNPHTKSLEFWNWCVLNIKAEHPEVIFLAEAFTRPKRKYYLGKAGFTHGYTYFTWRNHPAELRQYVEELSHSGTQDYFWPNFWPNTPDILHADLQSGLRSAFIGRYILAATLSSNMGIYGPAYELCDSEPFPGKEENNHNEKYQLKAWDLDRPGNIRAEIARMNALRNAHPAFQRTFNVSFIDCSNDRILAFLKQNFDRSDRFLVVVNMDWAHKQVGTLDLSPAQLELGDHLPLHLVDRLPASPRDYLWESASPYVELDPAISPAHVFQIVG